jgi:hypothetical protein
MAPSRSPTVRPRTITVRGQGGAVPLSPQRNPTASLLLASEDEPTVVDASPED